jgi:glutamate-5-semialdehyde dehydrogenase
MEVQHLMSSSASSSTTATSPLTSDEVKMEKLLATAKQAFLGMATLDSSQKNQALRDFATLLEKNTPFLLAANEQDMQAAKKNALTSAMLQRLKLDAGKLTQLVQGIKDVANLPEPIGRLLESTELDACLILEKRTVPLGLIAIIFESRPDVLPQIVSLILKSGNAVVFKGGSEAQQTNAAFMSLLQQLQSACPFLPEGWATLIEGREAVASLLNFHQYVDLVIPRGSNAMVRHIMESTRIPVLGHADGVCHLYVHQSANREQALNVIRDSKVQAPSACNALETLLVDQAICETFLPLLGAMAKLEGIALRGDATVCHLIKEAATATEEDWQTEYGDLTLSVKVVGNPDEAIEHINTFGSHHTDGILADDADVQALFCESVDSASVFVNASTRFADGFRYGFGAEIGISTSRTHARGPVGLEGLVSSKYLLHGHHHVVADYVGQTPKRQFLHRRLFPKTEELL